MHANNVKKIVPVYTLYNVRGSCDCTFLSHYEAVSKVEEAM